MQLKQPGAGISSTHKHAVETIIKYFPSIAVRVFGNKVVGRIFAHQREK
jgi:hypothetical protein